MIQNETSLIDREYRLSEHNILAKLAGFSHVIGHVGYPWISPHEAYRLSLDVINPDVLYDTNI